MKSRLIFCLNNIGDFFKMITTLVIIYILGFIGILILRSKTESNWFLVILEAIFWPIIEILELLVD